MVQTKIGKLQMPRYILIVIIETVVSVPSHTNSAFDLPDDVMDDLLKDDTLFDYLSENENEQTASECNNWTNKTGRFISMKRKIPA